MRLVDPIEIDALAAMLADTFADDPFYQWYFRNGAEPGAYFAGKLRDGAARSDAFVTPDRNAVLICERYPVRKAGSAANAPEVTPADSERDRQSRAFFARLAATHPAPAHVYLDIIGVGAAARGTGLGSQLMSHWLRLLDETGPELVFLHASTLRTAAFYERFGFVPGLPEPLPEGIGAVLPMTRGK